MKPHVCPLCKKTFVHSSSLSSHLRLHRGDKPHSCEYCGKTFLQRGDRDDHVRKHTGERPFSCQHCPKSFRTRAMWFEHARWVETVELLEILKCSFNWHIYWTFPIPSLLPPPSKVLVTACKSINQTYSVGYIIWSYSPSCFPYKVWYSNTYSNESGNFFSESIVMNVHSLVIFVDLHSAVHILWKITRLSTQASAHMCVRYVIRHLGRSSICRNM
jgi:hypothetical protein